MSLATTTMCGGWEPATCGWRGGGTEAASSGRPSYLGRLRGFLPVPEVLDCGGDDRLSWSLTAAMPGTAYEDLCVQPAPPGLRDLAREVAALLRALHEWSVPGDLADLLRYPGKTPIRWAAQAPSWC